MSKIILILLLSSISVYAQDVITLRTGEQIEARVTEISPTELRYRRFDQLEGPIRIIPLAEVFAINYESGLREIINPLAPAAGQGTPASQIQMQEQPAQTPTPQAQIQSQPVLTHSYWRGIRQNGRPVGTGQVRAIMAGNSAALELYNSGRRLEMVGFCVAMTGLGLMTTGLIIRSPLLFLVGLPIAGGSFAFEIPGRVKVRNAVILYNTGLISYKPPPYQINFGITSTGGVGLSMRF